jgi:hypothetical protein
MTFVPDKGGFEADTAGVCSAYRKTGGFYEDCVQHPFSTNTVTKAAGYRACPTKSISDLSV